VPNQPKGSLPKAGLAIPIVEGGFPHSEILGSKPVRGSPGLIAAYHVLHRLSAPRHPPDALLTLDRSHYRHLFPRECQRHSSRPSKRQRRLLVADRGKSQSDLPESAKNPARMPEAFVAQSTRSLLSARPPKLGKAVRPFKTSQFTRHVVSTTVRSNAVGPTRASRPGIAPEPTGPVDPARTPFSRDPNHRTCLLFTMTSEQANRRR
jgi:hypothetical protein